MERIGLKSYGKINLSLDVLGRRDNGYHDLVMIMQTVSLFDEISIAESESGIVIECDMPGVPSDNRNIAYKAADLLIKEFHINSGVIIRIDKSIPAAAGMAGGSSNAAAVLKGMNEIFSLGLTVKELQRIGLRLGADVPYCISGGTCLAEGVGEILTPLRSMPHCYVAIANPPYEVSTAEIFDRIDKEKGYDHPNADAILKGIEEGNLNAIAYNMGNVLESVTIRVHPDIEEIKKLMLVNGALGSLMTGSGPTVFGLFKEKSGADRAVKEISDKGLAYNNYVTTTIHLGGTNGN